MSVRELARQIRTGQHVPDILDCLAQLSNDEVPTPPKLARAMLDQLPGEVWARPDFVWLDPFCKSGIFLREAAARLLEGLSEQIPDFEERRDHIYRDMLWGTSITEMTGMISRRSLYYSRDASGPASVVHFDDEAGHLPFVRAEHTFPEKDGTITGGCEICGAPPDLERGTGRENYAYSFIHGAYPTKEMEAMKFDVIVGNPPYQIDSDGNTRTRPVYQLFVQQALSLNPRYAAFITPSRWFAGGLGLAEFRSQMLTDHRIRNLVDYPKVYDAFPGVKIRGGVSYFLWDREYDGPCEVQTMWNNAPHGEPVARYLDEFDVLVRRNEAVEVLHKIKAKGEATLNHQVLPSVPFGFQTNFHGLETKNGMTDPVLLYGSKRQTWVERSQIEKNPHLVDRHKVLMLRAYGEDGDGPFRVTAAPRVVGPATACTMTYLVIGDYATDVEAQRFAAYMETKFFRFLVWLRMNTQDLKRDQFAFVPVVPMDRTWTDDQLYDRYSLTDAEREYIEGQIREMHLK